MSERCAEVHSADGLTLRCVLKAAHDGPCSLQMPRITTRCDAQHTAYGFFIVRCVLESGHEGPCSVWLPRRPPGPEGTPLIADLIVLDELHRHDVVRNSA